MKNGMNSIRNELQLNPDSCKQIYFNPLWSQQKRNEFDPDWNSIRIHVSAPLPGGAKGVVLLIRPVPFTNLWYNESFLGYSLVDKRSKWCNQNVQADCVSLYARIGQDVHGTGMAWRCYCAKALYSSKITYKYPGGSTAYETKHEDIVTVVWNSKLDCREFLFTCNSI